MKQDSDEPQEPFLPWLAQLLQTNDSFFPSGAYAHSFGLETLAHLGVVTDAVSLGKFLHDSIMPALQHTELPTVHIAYEAARRHDLSDLIELDGIYSAMKGSSELRQASSRIGSQRLDMLMHIVPSPILFSLQEALRLGKFAAHSPIVHGVQTALSSTPLDAGLLSYYYQNLASLIAASLKLIRIGQITGQKLLAECLSKAHEIIAGAKAVDLHKMGWFQPLLDIASAQHEAAYTRIFIS